MTVSVDAFGKSLLASGLMTADELKSLWTGISADGRPKDGSALAQMLVDRGKLTTFQTKEILEGRGARLLMGDYVILQEIGAGGMGQVYRARHRRMERVVALKVMSAAAMKDEAAVKRFQREVRAAAKLEHPNIVTAYDSGEAGAVNYLVMQFVDGGDLSSLVKRNGPLEIERAVDYMIQAAKGLAFAHGEGVIHRDIKPANLLLDKKGVVKILDMGLARIESSDDGLTATEQVMGTVDYMSPEQAANTKSADARADIYSLGCTLWFLLTGKKLYDGDTMISRLMAHRDGALPSLVKARDDAPWPLEQALHKMIAKRPQDRFQTMDDVIAALTPFGASGASSQSDMGSSIGGGSDSKNEELASFLKSVGPGSRSQAKPAASTTNVDVEATAQFTTAGVDTDPNSEAPRSGFLAKSQATGKSGKGGPPLKLIVGGVGALVIVAALGAWLGTKRSGGHIPAPGDGRPVAANPVITASAPTPIADVPRPPTALSLSELLDSPDYVWSEPENLGPNVNGPENDGIIGLTNDELRLYFRAKDPAGLVRGYEAVRGSPAEPFGKAKFAQPMTTDAYLAGDGLSFAAIVRTESNRHDLILQRRPTPEAAWDKPTDIGTQINTPQDERRPTFSPDGLTLIFSRFRDSGTGSDLWISQRNSQDAPFGPPKNVGPAVNNSEYSNTIGVLLGDGETIIFRRNGGLYFTFAGRNGARSALTLRNHPFAETSDTLDLWFTADARTAYFSADRPGGHGGLDLWVTRRVPKGTVSQAPPASFLATNNLSPEVPPPPGDYALKFNNSGVVEFDEAVDYPPEAYTVEAWVRPDAHVKAADVITLSDRVGLGLDFVDPKRWRLWQVLQPSGYCQPTSVNTAELGKRVHLAGVCEKTQCRLYVDGNLVSTRGAAQGAFVKGGKPLSIGSEFNGVVDELRISKSVRYRADFSPPAKHEPDADTLALYHCDEGFGNVLKDSSGNNRNGRIYSAKWVKSDGSPVTPQTPAAKVVYLDGVPEVEWNGGYGRLGKHGVDHNGNPFQWIGQQPAHALFTHPHSASSTFVTYTLDGKYDEFLTTVGLIQNPTNSPVQFRIFGDDKRLWESPPLNVSQFGTDVRVDVRNVNVLKLEVNCPGDSANAHAAWMDPRLTPVKAATGNRYALQFDGREAHVVTPLVHDTNSPLTIEVTLLAGPAKGAIVSNSESSGLGLDIGDGILHLVAARRSNTPPEYARAVAAQPLDAAQPHRIAGVYDGKSVRIFVDGKLTAATDFTGEFLPSTLPFILGASPEENGIDYPFTGTLDEVRISKSARYATDYSPSDRLESDADTLALYHCDDGAGDVLTDSSGNNRHGKLIAAKWVRVEGKPAESIIPE